MAKTAQFDRGEVIEKATNLYWKKGYHATSMRNLQDEIDMRPGSIYAAFGSKDGLFKEALKNYANHGLAHIERCRQHNPSPLGALKDFVKAQVIETADGAPNGVCMLAKTLAELTGEHQELLDETKAHLSKLADEFTKLIEQAQQMGELDKDKDAVALAHYIQIQMAGLRTFAKMNNDKALLNQMIEDIFAHHLF
ncbi:TetR/AcrR family transcriptional regulator [Vibrio ezurae]|uniref:Putative transcriptional regulator n=1 Tax=Vibrio ezurae NBRC 102218 TaxID=1219080 RepID=U3CFU8_9VIBR|nr:TetR/AcrR family transcriptional regulator [Vibrio ezurae]GAD80109.1 putative transcriptional regulator [Vibrio ezurae NBRC 102218]